MNNVEDAPTMKHILLMEPFYSGSHKVLMDLLNEELMSQPGVSVHLATLPGKKWHWRARTSALYFAQNVPHETYSCIFASCVLPLHELLGLRPDFQNAKKILYFHENQLVYPVRKSKERDFQYGYNQIMSCLAADKILFNSKFNQESFLSSIKSFFKLQPDFRPKDLREQIEPKCECLYFPLNFEKIQLNLKSKDEVGSSGQEEKQIEDQLPILKIVWPHRWYFLNYAREFDKNPDLFFRVMYRLQDEGLCNFRLSVLGENFSDNPPIFAEAESRLKGLIIQFGYLPTKEDYYKVLHESDIVVSTADHEFFGVAMLEASFLGCFPLCPKKLVYPEIFSNFENLYKDENDLFHKLKQFLKKPRDFKTKKDLFRSNFNYSLYDWSVLKSLYLSFLLS